LKNPGWARSFLFKHPDCKLLELASTLMRLKLLICDQL